MHDTSLGSKDIEMLSRLLNLGERPEGGGSFFSESHDLIDAMMIQHVDANLDVIDSCRPDERVARSDTELKVRQWLDITAFIDLRNQLQEKPQTSEMRVPAAISLVS